MTILHLLQPRGWVLNYIWHCQTGCSWLLSARPDWTLWRGEHTSLYEYFMPWKQPEVVCAHAHTRSVETCLDETTSNKKIASSAICCFDCTMCVYWSWIISEKEEAVCYSPGELFWSMRVDKVLHIRHIIKNSAVRLVCSNVALKINGPRHTKQFEVKSLWLSIKDFTSELLYIKYSKCFTYIISFAVSNNFIIHI